MKEIGFVEAVVHLKKGEDYLNSKYIVQSTDLFYVHFPTTYGGYDETRKNTKGLFVGWWGS